MSWIDIAWPMMGAASLTLALVYFLLWVGQRREYPYLMFSLAASSVGALAILELLAMRTTSVAQYGELLRWANVFIAVLATALVGYVRLRFRAGSLWLAYAAIGLRWLSLIPNFFSGANLNFSSVQALTHVGFLGGTVAVPLGTASPWAFLDQLCRLLVLAFLLHAIVEVLRRGDPSEQRRVVVVCGGITTCYLAMTGLVALVNFGQLRAPITFNFPALIMIAVMAYDLGAHLVRSSQLTVALKGSQLRLRESEHRFRMVFEASPTALLMVDTGGLIVLANAQASSVFGYRIHELIGMDVEALVPGRVRAAHIAYREQFMGQPQARNMAVGRELHGLRKDGSQVPVVVGLRPIATPEGLFVLASVADITERLALEREATLQREELAHLSRVGMLGELSGSMAHELNQPLAAILSNAQAAQRFLDRAQPDLDEVRASLADIVADDKRAGEVIRRLRAMLKKQAAVQRPLYLNDLVLEVLRMARSDLLNRNASAHTELASGLPLVNGDQVQLQQVLINLLLNAGDAMVGSENRDLTIRSRLTSQGWVEVSFIDSGPGIPPDDLERIFQPFVTTKRDGIGLGLAVCRSIIAAHGGRLWAENNGARGATLRFALPPSVMASA
jgi:PAS domain S-box-containing protein